MLVDATSSASTVPKMGRGKSKPEARAGRPKTELERLFNERIAPTGMTQDEFGALYGIGSQQVVWQYLSGHRRPGVQMAAKFAAAFKCTIRDIDSGLSDNFAALATEVLPVLGKKISVEPFANTSEPRIHVVRERIASEGGEVELLRAFRRSNITGQARILEQVRLLQREYPIDSKVFTMEDRKRRKKS